VLLFAVKYPTLDILDYSDSISSTGAKYIWGILHHVGFCTGVYMRIPL